MGYFVTAKQAREKARKDTIIQGETAAIEAAVFSAIDSNLLTVTLGDATTMTHTTAGAQLILAQLYYSVCARWHHRCNKIRSNGSSH